MPHPTTVNLGLYTSIAPCRPVPTAVSSAGTERLEPDQMNHSGTDGPGLTSEVWHCCSMRLTSVDAVRPRRAAQTNRPHNNWSIKADFPT